MIFKFNDGTTMPIDSNMVKLSAFFDEQQKLGVKELSLSEAFIGEAFDGFCKKFFPDFEEKLSELEHTTDKEDWWMEMIAENPELAEPVKGFYQDDLIRVGNAAAEYGYPGVIHACAWVMASKTENMRLNELREYLNEEYDFPDEIKAKIENCPEYGEL
ncbi:hypothetical protein M3Y97_00046800 [Aphelenchoides bicaudatus]|nr:hypothetical protein M3Y97_00046800 [Aphelenchoides bicaudatus]